MSIKVIEDGPDIVLTRSEKERLMREWRESQRMTVRPVSFEAWLRAREYSRKHQVRS